METGSRNPHKTQLTQISAVVLDPRSLDIVPGGIFNTEVKPIFDDAKAVELNLDPVEQEALDLTHKTRDRLEKAPTVDVVWPDFVNFVTRYKRGGGKSSNWDNPIAAGFNITNFDNVIVNRMCQKYGPFDEKYSSQKIFHPIHSIDLLHDFFRWTDNSKINDNNSLSLDSIRKWLGMPMDGAHDALNDVLDCAEILKRFLMKYRFFFEKTKFAGAMAGWKRPDIKG